MMKTIHFFLAMLGGGSLVAATTVGCFSERSLTDVVGQGGTAGTCGAECCAAVDCPAPASPCILATCDDGSCSSRNIEAGQPATTQEAGQCNVIKCDGAGKGVLSPKDVGVDCTESGGRVCDGSGTCVPCNVNADCLDPLKPLCSTHECVDKSCGDGKHNGKETDNDCGGDCSPCDTGKLCIMDADCVSGVCSAEGGAMKCQVPECNDGVKNGEETDVDCGKACPACGPGKMCEQDSDCVGQSCSSGVCAESCADGLQNNLETAVDCGGPNCGDCLGENCTDDPLDCKSGYCVDGVCCDGPCGGVCEACTASLTLLTGGTCGAVQLGMIDSGECAGKGGCGDVPNKCQCEDGLQNGTEAGVDCAGPCPDKCADGNPCQGGYECASSECVDGICCATACGQCKTCSAQGDSCVPLSAGSTSSTCSGTSMCDGAGLCKLKNLQMCPSDAACLSNYCVSSVCALCTSDANCSDKLGNGYGCRAGACKKVLDESCVLNVECETHYCDGSGKCAACAQQMGDDLDCVSKSCTSNGNCLLEAGAPCAVNMNCASNNCVDADGNGQTDGQLLCAP